MSVSKEPKRRCNNSLTIRLTDEQLAAIRGSAEVRLTSVQRVMEYAAENFELLVAVMWPPVKP